jgi:D-methionine transport system substrate-binding protein
MITRRDFLKVTGVAAAAAALTACGGSSASGTAATKLKVAVPNDTTNEARALTLLEKNGFFKLKADAGLTATAKDIEENPLNVTVDEVEAAQVPNVLQDEDYAVINSNYAISAGLDPINDALAMEDGTSAYVNVLVCKEGNEEEPKIKALVAALQSQQVKDFMDENYKGAVVSVVENPTDGYDSSIDYDALNGETVSCAATPAPHCEVLEICKDILAAKGITLDIQEFDDYIQPNNVVEDGQIDTNYFQHQPYLDDFNAEHGTHLVTVAGIHVEPMGIYGGKQDSLAPIEG